MSNNDNRRSPSSVWEGIGGPIPIDSYTLDGIDPTLDSCCQREVRREMGF